MCKPYAFRLVERWLLANLKKYELNKLKFFFILFFWSLLRHSSFLLSFSVRFLSRLNQHKFPVIHHRCNHALCAMAQVAQMGYVNSCC